MFFYDEFNNSSIFSMSIIKKIQNFHFMNRKNVPPVVGKQIPSSQQRIRKVSPTKNSAHSQPPPRSRIQNNNQSASQANRPKTTAQKPPPSRNQQPSSNKNDNFAKKDMNNQSSNKSANPNAIPAISREYDQMRLRLQELKELLTQLEAKWSKAIDQKTAEHETIKSNTIKQHDMKLKQLEQSFTQTGVSNRNNAMKNQVDEMKKKAENLRSEGKNSEADALLRQAKSVESQMIDGERYTKIRELEARKQPLIKAHQIKMQQMKEQQESEINKLKKDRNIEIEPIKNEIEKLEKRIHGDAAKAARSKLCLKE